MSIHYFNYFDDITPTKVKIFMAVLADVLQKHHPKTFYITLSSGGGDVNAGLTLYHYLRGLPVEIITHNIGKVDSIASVIFMAGKKRHAAKNASFLFHGVSMNVAQAAAFNLAQLRELVSQVEVDEAKIADVLVANTKLTRDEVIELYRFGASKSSEFALEKGVIHQISEFNLPGNAPFISMNMP